MINSGQHTVVHLHSNGQNTYYNHDDIAAAINKSDGTIVSTANDGTISLDKIGRNHHGEEDSDYRSIKNILEEILKFNGESGHNSLYSLSDSVIDTVTNSQGENIAGMLKGGKLAKFSLSSWTEAEKEAVRKFAKKNGFSKEEVLDWIDDVNSIAAIIASDTDRLDYVADRSGKQQTANKPNGEYKWTIDFSIADLLHAVARRNGTHEQAA